MTDHCCHLQGDGALFNLAVIQFVALQAPMKSNGYLAGRLCSMTKQFAVVGKEETNLLILRCNTRKALMEINHVLN